MRLDVVQRGAFYSSNRVERTQLVEDQVRQFGRVKLDRAAAESLAIIEPWMRADCDPMLDGHGQGLSNGVWVAGVETAGDVGRRDQLEQGGICLGQALAHVGVQIQLSHSLILGPRIVQPRARSSEAPWSSADSLPASKMVQRSAREPPIVQMAAALVSDRSARPCRRPATR